MQKIKNLLPGLILAALIYFVADFLSTFIGRDLLSYSKSPISTVLFSVLIGIMISNFIKIPVTFEGGINFSVRYILRLGIILLGIRISLSDVVEFGSISIPLVILCIATVIIAVRLLKKVLSVSTKMSYLIAIGTSICGASAIVAMAPVINAKKGEITYAIANITVFGIMGMFLYPYIAHEAFSGNQSAIGLFLGTAIHETAQVAASGLIYEQQYLSSKVLEVATITKLVRNTFLLAMIPLFAYIYARERNSEEYSLKSAFPLFVLGFVFMVVFRTVGDHLVIENIVPIPEILWKDVIYFVKVGSGVCLSIAMAGLGLATNVNELRAMGLKPFAAGLIAAFIVGVVSFITIHIFTVFDLI
tara:strand:- start:731 stop:1810 length:1080 start_codon:yes stop_codon:yes gene_type:complete